MKSHTIFPLYLDFPSWLQFFGNDWMFTFCIPVFLSRQFLSAAINRTLTTSELRWQRTISSHSQYHSHREYSFRELDCSIGRDSIFALVCKFEMRNIDLIQPVGKKCIPIHFSWGRIELMKMTSFSLTIVSWLLKIYGMPNIRVVWFSMWTYADLMRCVAPSSCKSRWKESRKK